MDEQEFKEKRMQKQYQRLIDARNFHYDNLNKWLRTFYVIIGTLFAAFYTLTNTTETNVYVVLVIGILGYLVSVGAVLSIKGYYYWETNWIMLVHHFEKVYFANEPDDMRVYSVFANQKVNSDIESIRQGANISTSKVALAITCFITWLWGSIVVCHCINLIPVCENNDISCCMVLYAGIVSLVLTYLLVLAGGCLFPSDLENVDDLGLTKDNINKPLKAKIKKK